MVNVLIGLMGLYLVVVGIGGNGVPFIQWASGQGQFLAWIAVALVLVALVDHPSTHEFGVIFGSLIIIAYAVSHYQTVMEQFTAAAAAANVTVHTNQTASGATASPSVS